MWFTLLLGFYKALHLDKASKVSTLHLFSDCCRTPSSPGGTAPSLTGPFTRAARARPCLPPPGAEPRQSPARRVLLAARPGVGTGAARGLLPHLPERLKMK